MTNLPGMERPDLQALPRIQDRMTFLYLGVIPASFCFWVMPSSFPRASGGDPTASDTITRSTIFSLRKRG